MTPEEARAIAREAYIYGYPVVDSYRIQYAYFVDKNDKSYKAPWNHIKNIPEVYTPADTAIQTPNSDTPYSFVGLDLRAEPIVISVPRSRRSATTASSSSTPTPSISPTSVAVLRATTPAAS